MPVNLQDPVFAHWFREGLVWLPERGMGFYPITNGDVYNEAYFRKYQGYAVTDLGRALTRARVELVERHAPGVHLVDVGIGCGQFVSQRLNRPLTGMTYGFDVCPNGVTWLKEQNLWWDPYKKEIEAASFWDSLEHIPDAAQILVNVTRWVFCSLPLFTGPDHVLRSKHFRTDEHCWYWTRDGLIAWMAEQGFRCLEHNTMESLLGREDIHTFVFRRE